VHLGAKFIHKWSLTLLPDFHARGLRLVTGITDEGGPVIDKLDAFDGTASDKFANCIRSYMGETTMQHSKVHALIWDCHSIHPLDFVESILACCNGTDKLASLVPNLTGILFESDRAASLGNVVN
jgi:hypothetical protein